MRVRLLGSEMFDDAAVSVDDGVVGLGKATYDGIDD